jgi:hypothetical protein
MIRKLLLIGMYGLVKILADIAEVAVTRSAWFPIVYRAVVKRAR